ncbi:enoyl-CoA hydratase/isomerase family protein [Bradyrhizobium diazoefficiens]|uniref:enoyl-CoA hydratase-related protein n=1 Tax=Bradyrhizobium diazoefficiens TaxID=1355477 RepID=UPI00190E32CE|nr:enoyl-CoA hydratase-related protein [Bradyrhizobium diazoefficiens]QQO35562.1 enoyl-CoA hydratase/isomerase family protein [Bradyrhizobium diazoefficiens]
MAQTVQIDSGTSELLAEIRERVAVVTLNRPEARNAISDGMLAAWENLIPRFGEDSRVGSILIMGAQTAFSAGADVKGFGQNSGLAEVTFEQRVAGQRAYHRRLIGSLMSVRKPTVAAIGGPAAGAGLAVALSCDMRIAAESAVLTTAFARIALSGDCGISWLLTRLVGFARARELMFLSERIDAQRAATIGLVNRVVPATDLGETAFGLAASLAAGPTFAFARMKDSLDHAVTSSLAESMDYEAVNVIMTAQSLDHKEGVRSFMEKRKPAFEGR